MADAWVTFGDRQTAQLDTANDHTLSGIEIVQKCEKRDAEVVEALRPKSFLEKLWPF